MGSKYIIKNCPSCYYIYSDNEYECNWRGSGITRPCKDCTDCVMKQIVDHCLDNEKYGDEYYTRPILEKLDIQEIE